MITVEEADTIIFKNILELPPARVALQEAFSRILCEDLIADRDFPSFHRVTMDGIAINFSSWENGKRIFPIAGTQKAGIPPMMLKDGDSCMEVMTGAVLPGGCDCVIPVEHMDCEKGRARLKGDVPLVRRQNIHLQGSDHRAGDVLVLKGNRLLAPQVAIAASIGKAEVLVSKLPRIAVIGTGDEIVGIHQRVEPYQIRQSNSYAIQAALVLQGYNDVARFHLKDDKDEMTQKLGDILDKFDVIILSGGVSMGQYDYVPQVLTSLGVDVLFHQVKQRPGKPFWFGKSKQGRPVFALPGNPVSTQIGVYRYVLAYLNRAVNAKAIPCEYAVLDEDVEVKTDLTYFLPVRLMSKQGKPLAATPVIPSGSGDFVALAKSDGFIELPANTFHFSQGTPARLFRWRF